MDTRQHHRDDQHQNPPNPSGDPAAEDLSSVHAQAKEFLAVGSQVLHSALSGDSQAMLHATRQHSGQ